VRKAISSFCESVTAPVPAPISDDLYAAVFTEPVDELLFGELVLAVVADSSIH